jgi:ABC-type anion transport system duplicated permease subunit
MISGWYHIVAKTVAFDNRISVGPSSAANSEVLIKVPAIEEHTTFPAKILYPSLFKLINEMTFNRT